MRKIKAVQDAQKEAESPEQAQQNSSDFWDALFLVGAVLFALVLVSATMVSHWSDYLY